MGRRIRRHKKRKLQWCDPISLHLVILKQHAPSPVSHRHRNQFGDGRWTVLSSSDSQRFVRRRYRAKFWLSEPDAHHERLDASGHFRGEDVSGDTLQHDVWRTDSDAKLLSNGQCLSDHNSRFQRHLLSLHYSRHYYPWWSINGWKRRLGLSCWTKN
jgi:hypothetical protein